MDEQHGSMIPDEIWMIRQRLGETSRWIMATTGTPLAFFNGESCKRESDAMGSNNSASKFEPVRVK